MVSFTIFYEIIIKPAPIDRHKYQKYGRLHKTLLNALLFVYILKIQTKLELNKAQSNFTESVDVYLYLFTAKPFRY